jgi:hypothetical protein
MKIMRSTKKKKNADSKRCTMLTHSKRCASSLVYKPQQHSQQREKADPMGM